jgi:GR25 family glycosyltransferase involved in LPS biosynthesis
MELQMSFQSNTNFKFIEGIDGSTDLETAALMKKYFKYMNIQNDSQDVPFSSSTMIDSLKNKYNFKRQHITKGSLGLIQSIFLLLNDFVKGDEDHALIFEDDIYTLKDLDNNLFINKELLNPLKVFLLLCVTGVL